MALSRVRLGERAYHQTSCGSKARQGPMIVAITMAFCTSRLFAISDFLE